MRSSRDSELGGRVAGVREIHRDVYFNRISRTSFSLLMNKTITLVRQYYSKQRYERDFSISNLIPIQLSLSPSLSFKRACQK